MNDKNWNSPNYPQWQHPDNQEPPPNYSETVEDSSKPEYGKYPQSYPQNPAAYPPPQQGYAATGAYPPQGYTQGGAYNNYYQQPYYPPPASSNNNQSVIVTNNTQNVVVEQVRDYTCLAVFAIFMFLPTGIVALLKANDAQNEYRMGNIEQARASNRRARTCINISVGLGVLCIILAIVIPVVVFFAVLSSYPSTTRIMHDNNWNSFS